MIGTSVPEILPTLLFRDRPNFALDRRQHRRVFCVSFGGGRDLVNWATPGGKRGYRRTRSLKPAVVAQDAATSSCKEGGRSQLVEHQRCRIRLFPTVFVDAIQGAATVRSRVVIRSRSDRRPVHVTQFRCALVVVAAVLGLLGCEPAPRMATEVDLDSMRALLATPAWSADEWQRFCEGAAGSGVCRVTVQVECPPDCGTYRLVLTDSLARRVW